MSLNRGVILQCNTQNPFTQSTRPRITWPKAVQTWPKAAHLLERRMLPIPQGRMLLVEELEGVTAVGVNVAKDLEAASLADEEGPPLGHRQERAVPRDHARCASRAHRPHQPS